MLIDAAWDRANGDGTFTRVFVMTVEVPQAHARRLVPLIPLFVALYVPIDRDDRLAFRAVSMPLALSTRLKEAAALVSSVPAVTEEGT